MKKINYILMLSLVFILTGCVKFDANMEIKFDKSMNYSIIIALDRTNVKNNENVLTTEQLRLLENKHFAISKYSNGNMEGYVLTKNIDNIDSLCTDKDVEYDLSGIISGNSNSEYLFKIEKGIFKNKYSAVLIFNPKDSGLSIDDVDMSLYEDKITDLNFNLSIPFGATRNNATSNENSNRKLNWHLSSTIPEKIEFEFYLYNLKTIFIVFGILLIIIILLIVVIKKKKNKKTNVLDETSVKIDNYNDDFISEPVLKKKVIVMEESDK